MMIVLYVMYYLLGEEACKGRKQITETWKTNCVKVGWERSTEEEKVVDWEGVVRA